VIGDLFSAITTESPLIQPALIGHDFKDGTDPQLGRSLSVRIQEKTGLMPWDVPCDGWVGVVCPSVKAAIWMVRGLVVSNVFARREDTVLHFPVNPTTDTSGNFVVQAVSQVHGFAQARRVL